MADEEKKQPPRCPAFVGGVLEGAKVKSIYPNRMTKPEPLPCGRCSEDEKKD